MPKERTTERYPWHVWFSTPQFRLVRGKDYLCSTASMTQQVRNAANKRGVGVSIEANDTDLTVTIKEE